MKTLLLLLWVALAACPITYLDAEIVKILIQGDTQKILDKKHGKQDNFIPFMSKVLTDPVTSDANFILQMGDIVETDGDNSDRPQQYAIAREGWQQLDDKIPYVLNIGNNDDEGEFLDAFPLDHYNEWPSFVANYDDHRNVAHQFNAGGVDWLVISLRYHSPGEDRRPEFDWARGLIEEHADHKVIFIKHSVNWGAPMVNRLKEYSNVVFILSGHTESEQKLLTGDNGNKIGWIRTNHHDATRDSYFRVLLIDTATGTVRSSFYSPQYEKFWHDPTAPYHNCVKSAPWTYTDFDFGVQSPPSAGQGNDAKFISMEIPCCLVPGKEFEARVSYKNTGASTWTANSQYKLGSENSRDNRQWGAGTNRTRTSVEVAPGENYTFNIECIAPSIAGKYNFQYRMLQETVQWFGEYSENRIVRVTSNKVMDGSFEGCGVGLSPWKLGSGAAISTDRKKSGNSALKLTNASTPTRQTIDLKPNTDYDISVYVKNDEVTSGNIFFDTNDIFDEEIGGREFRIEPGEADQWKKLSGRFNSGTQTSVMIRIFATDLDGTAYFDDVEIVPSDIEENNAPVITSFPTRVAYRGAPYNYLISATDADDDSLEYSAVSIPGWLQFNAEEKTLTGIPNRRYVGTHAVTLCVSDGVENDLETFTIRVLDSPYPFNEWKGIHNVSGVTEDVDNDGLVNLLEFALGGDPRKNDASNIIPKFSLDGSSADISFRRDQLTTTYTIQKSTNMIDWLDHAIIDDTHGWVGDTCTVSIPTSGEKEFFKLKVNQ